MSPEHISGITNPLHADMNSNRRSGGPLRSLRLWMIIAFTALAAYAPASLAQTPVAGTDSESHPAHIHAGTCAELGEVVVPLEDVASLGGERVGAATAHPVKTSRNVVDMPLEEIIAGAHAVNVHLSTEEIGTFIACGDIGGELTTDDEGRTHLQIGLGELNDSGHTGVVWFGEDGDQTEVVISLIEPDEMD